MKKIYLMKTVYNLTKINLKTLHTSSRAPTAIITSLVISTTKRWRIFTETSSLIITSSTPSLKIIIARVGMINMLKFSIWSFIALIKCLAKLSFIIWSITVNLKKLYTFYLINTFFFKNVLTLEQTILEKDYIYHS